MRVRQTDSIHVLKNVLRESLQLLSGAHVLPPQPRKCNMQMT